jgi:hypothetical protein
MKKVIISALLAWPFALAAAQDQSLSLLDSLPGLGREPKEESVTEAPQRPDPQKTIGELSSLRLSSKQEERLLAAMGKKTKEFDKLMEEYNATSYEEKKWRSKADGQRQELLTINQDMPDLIRGYLDEEQRQSYNDMLDAKNKPAPKEEPAITEKPAVYDEIAAPKPVKKRRVLRKKRRLPVPTGAAIPTAPDKAALVPGDDEHGQVMVDKEQGAPNPPIRKKRRILKRKTAASAKAPAPAEDIMSNKPVVAQPSGNQAPASEEDAGSYP